MPVGQESVDELRPQEAGAPGDEDSLRAEI